MAASRLWLILFLLLVRVAHAACVDDQGISRNAVAQGGKPLAFDLRPEQYRSLLSIRDKVSAVAGPNPELMLCEFPQPNAVATFRPDGTPLVAIDPLFVRVLDQPMLAWVVAHEFAHLQMKHPQKMAAARRALARDAAMRLAYQANRGRLSEQAVQNEIAGLKADSAQNSRALEEEADGIGFEFLVAAGFDPGAASKAARTLMARGLGKEFSSFNDDHPGWLDRIAKLDQMEVANRFAVQAKLDVDDQKWGELQTLVDRWLAEYPNNGQAWYFKGMALRHARRPAMRPLGAFLKSVTLDRNNAEAWQQYCVELFRENYKWESARCSRNIKYSYLYEDYLAQTFKNRLAVGGADLPAYGANGLYVGRTASGSRLITNADDGARDRGLQPMPPAWRPMP